MILLSLSFSDADGYDQELQQRELQVRQAHRMETLGQLAGGVAHDFNNLMTVILSCVEMLLTETEPSAIQRDDLNRIRGAAERATNLTRQLLAYSRPQVLEEQVVDLDRVLQDLTELLTRVLGDHIELAMESCWDSCWVRVDPGQLEQVIMNLVLNARDFMSEGGRLTIRTHVEEVDEDPLGTRPGVHVVLTVADTGRGMSPDVQARIFEPFFTTRPGEGGTGLGLAMAFGIVRQSGGRILVSSEEGLGTTFKVYLPQVAAAASEEVTVPLAREACDGEGSEMILVVEDDEDLRAIARRSLERRGYTVLTAARDEEARRLLAEYGREVRLLLVDVNLPGLAGPALAEELQAEAPWLRVLFVSGLLDEAVFPGGTRPAGARFLQKPYRPTLLAREVRRTLDS